MGGSDENKTVLDSGEKYDPDSNTWTPIPPMLQVRVGLSCFPPQAEGLVIVVVVVWRGGHQGAVVLRLGQRRSKGQ